MKFLYLLVAISLYPFSLSAQNCIESYTEAPPFYPVKIKQGLGHKEYIRQDGKKLANIQDSFETSSQNGTRRLVLQGDILVSQKKTLKEREQEFRAIKKGLKQSHQFKVLYHNQFLGSSKNYVETINYAQSGSIVKLAGHKNLTHLASITSNQVFIYDQLKASQIAEDLSSGSYIRFVKNKEQKFKILKCGNRYQYLVQKVTPNGQVYKKEIAVDTIKCCEQPYQLQVVDNNSLKDLFSLTKVLKDRFFRNKQYENIADIERNNDGRVSLPVTIEKKWSHSPGPKSRKYPGADYYLVNRRQDEIKWGVEIPGADTWGTEQFICHFVDLAEKWKEHCMNLKKENFSYMLPKDGRSAPKKNKQNRIITPGNRRYYQCSMQVNDIAFYNKSKLHSRDLLGHRDHLHGECIDIRPFRRDDLLEKTKVGWSSIYMGLNKEFERFLKRYGATNILFNTPGHKNHIHFCMKKGNAKVRSQAPQCHN